MLDTDTSSYLIRGRYPGLDQRLAATPPDAVCISSVTRAELLYGVHRRVGAHRLVLMVQQFLGRVPSVPWDDAAADHYARVAAALNRAGTPIGPFDTLIAAHALSLGASVVTNNVHHFARVPGLSVENWTR